MCEICLTNQLDKAHSSIVNIIHLIHNSGDVILFLFWGSEISFSIIAQASRGQDRHIRDMQHNTGTQHLIERNKLDRIFIHECVTMV